MPAKSVRRTKSEPTAKPKVVLVRINDEGHRALRLLTVEQDSTLNALMIEAVNDLLSKHGKRRTALNPLLG